MNRGNVKNKKLDLNKKNSGAEVRFRKIKKIKNFKEEE